MHFQIPKRQWTKIEEYLQGLPQEETRGLQKSDYLDLTEQLLERYDGNTICDPEKEFQVCSRWVWIWAVLLSNGRKKELQTPFCEMMTNVCRMISMDHGTSLPKFSVTEVLLALSLMKENDTNGDWSKMTSSIDKINVEKVQSDENGMYALCGSSDSCSGYDDITLRFRLQLMEYIGSISAEEGLRRGGVWSLMAQSATGRLPYEGSKKTLHQQALLVSVLEYEAGKQAEEGNFVLAGRMRRGARLAAESFREEIRGIPVGCEEKENQAVLISAAAMCGAALFAHEDLPEHPAPCETGGYVLFTSPKFHQIFANGCGYSIQIDANGESDRDATGLGRIHKKGIPESLGLSVPFSEHSQDTLPEGCEPISASIGIGWDDGEGGVQYLSDLTGIKYALSIEEEKKDKLKFTITYTGNCLKNCGGIMETYSLDEGGLRYNAKLLESECKAVYARVPLFVTDGERESKIKQKAGQANVYLDKFRWRITTNASLSPDEGMAKNRNGVYKIVTLVHLEPKIRLNMSLCQENERE